MDYLISTQSMVQMLHTKVEQDKAQYGVSISFRDITRVDLKSFVLDISIHWTMNSPGTYCPKDHTSPSYSQQHNIKANIIHNQNNSDKVDCKCKTNKKM